ncbi:hypothetical protein GCM10009853_054240 [Glycomyces scopariae]
MTDDLDTGDDEFGEDFFATLEAAPDPAAEDAADDLLADAGGPGEFHYEAEGDGSFETGADDGVEGEADFSDASEGDFDGGFDPDDFPFELGGEG